MQKQFADRAFPLMETKEPTLFYVIRHSNAQSNLKSQLFSLLQALLDSSPISRQTMPLEKDGEPLKPKSLSTFNLNDVLGQFLRFLHLILICCLQEEGKRAHMYPTNPSLKAGAATGESTNIYFDRKTYIQIVKVMQTLL